MEFLTHRPVIEVSTEKKKVNVNILHTMCKYNIKILNKLTSKFCEVA